MWGAGDAHQSEKIFRSRLLFDLHCILGHFGAVGLGRQTSEPPAFDVTFETRLQIPTHGSHIVGADANSGLRLAVTSHCRAGLVESAAPRARGDTLEVLTRPVPEHFVIDLRH